jgi:hypothetical protein
MLAVRAAVIANTWDCRTMVGEGRRGHRIGWHPWKCRHLGSGILALNTLVSALASACGWIRADASLEVLQSASFELFLLVLIIVLVMIDLMFCDGAKTRCGLCQS